MELKQNTQVFFDDLTHTYLMGGKELTGVTSLMKQMGLSPDYSGISAEVLENAARRGQAVHRAIETYCKYGGGVIDERYADDVIPALAAYKTLAIDPLDNEYLVSDNETVASSIDIVARSGISPGCVDLIDIKTTSSVHKESVAWQLSIYKWLFLLQNPGMCVNQLWCLHIRDGKAKMIEVKEVGQGEVDRLMDCFRQGVPFVQKALEATSEEEKAVRAVADLERAILELDAELKRKKAEQETLKGEILDFMRKNNKTRWEISDELSFTRVEPSTRASIDSARLKKEMPDIYNSFLKESLIKESLRINLKK